VQQLGLTHGGRSLRDRKTAISLKNPPFAAVSRYDRGAIVYLGRFVHKLSVTGLAPRRQNERFGSSSSPVTE
jgi:hypothetical protein